MTDKERILKLLYMALVDIRVASYSQDHHTCFVLADVFHTVPLQLNRADKDEIDYADIITWLQQKCQERNCVSWFNNAYAHIVSLP